MNYFLKLSLEHIVLTKIATTLWNQYDVRPSMTHFLQSLNLSEVNIACIRFDSSKRQEEWQVIEEKVIKKVSAILLPEPLKKKVINFIGAIGLEILNWWQYHHEYLQLDLPNEFCWTPHGTVDEKKMAEAFIKNENLDIVSRYKLACVYCLEDDIPKLWDKIPENLRVEFNNKEGMIKVDQRHLVVFWTYVIKGEFDNLESMVVRREFTDSVNQLAFKSSTFGCHKAACEYFLQKLTQIERKESLLSCTEVCAKLSYIYDFLLEKHPYHPKILCFLVSQMDKEQQIEVLKCSPFGVLACFLNWPWQSHFMEMANRMWDFLSDVQYSLLLRKIVDRVRKSYKDCDYQTLFREFWQQSPNAYKKYVIAEFVSSGDLLSELFMIEDKENVTLILKDATVEQREQIIFSIRGKDICQGFVYSNKWDALKLFIQNCISSKEVMIKFKKELHITCSHSGKHTGKFKANIPCPRTLDQECTRYKWDEFSQSLLDDLIQENNRKRSLEESDNSLEKNLHSSELTMRMNQ